jgi:hypothetical protein
MNWLALDIGGANIKVSDGRQFARNHRFSLWRQPEQLVQRLRQILAEGPSSDHIAATMTGELADCFADKAEGVEFIVAALEDAVDRRHTRVYLSDGRMVTTQLARRNPSLVAAANWRALARYATRFFDNKTGWLIDVGSTTTDIIRYAEGAVNSISATDTERLRNNELLYTGVERTPVCAVVQSVPYRGQPCRVTHELFATMRDVYLIMGDLLEDVTDTHTADGRPATKACARARLGRMLCADHDEFHHRDAAVMASAVADAHGALLAEVLDALCTDEGKIPSSLLLCGLGEFLALRAIEKLAWRPTIASLSQQLGPAVSAAAPAYALAVLAREGDPT